MIKNFNEATLLLDFYGNLLTEKQLEIMSYHFEDDMSLGEIAEQLGITRQAVHDIIKRSEKLLLEYEDKLRLVEKFEKQKKYLIEIKRIIEDKNANLENAIKLINDIINL